MSRYDGELKAAQEASADELPVLMSLLAAGSEGLSPAERQQAIVCLLAASDGWREASLRLNGAFAGGSGETGLTAGKEE